VTWFNQDDETDNYKAIRDVLDGLSEAGFNGIRLPMWPVNDEIKGSVTPFALSGDETKNFTRDMCNDLSVTILEVLKTHELSQPNEDNTTYFDDDFHYFKVYWSPAYDGRQYQEGLTEF